MSDNINKKKTPDSINRDKQEEIIKELATESIPGGGEISPIHPGQEKLQQILAELGTATRQQQLGREQSLQSTLGQATITLQDARRVDSMGKLVAELERILASPAHSADPHTFLKVIAGLETHIQRLLQDADCQIAQSMQQAVSALAQSQAAMFDSQGYTQIQQLLQQCKNTLEEQWPQAENIH
ncbi:MAG: hypothetical protein GX376_05105 [Firmicutes bacterium]|nr:hypothetical protein [Bacillota bacterium]